MFFFTTKENAYLGFLLTPILGYINWRKTLCFLAIFAISLTVTDQTAYVFKKTVDRWRPDQYQYAEDNRMRTDSFPSAHASNITGAFVIISFFWPLLRYPMLGIMLFVCYSRIYLDKHFPFDVLAGILFGFIGANLVLKYIWKPFKKKNPSCDLKKGAEVN